MAESRRWGWFSQAGQEEAPEALLRVKTGQELRVQFWGFGVSILPLPVCFCSPGVGSERLRLILLYQASLEDVQIRLSSSCTRDDGEDAQMLVSRVSHTRPTVIWGGR